MTTLRESKRVSLSHFGLSLLRFVLKVLPLLAAISTALGILLTASTYKPRLANYILALYPRYRLAEEGRVLLETRKHSLKESSGKEILVSVLDIDHPSWPVVLDFVQSQIAIRKSERNEPGPALLAPPTPEGSPEKPSPGELPPIDFARIKTIVAAELETPKAGTKPLVPPYRLIVFWPNLVARRVYEFLSFQEFALDLRQMLLLEVRYAGIVASGIAFAITMVLRCLRWALRRYAPGLLATTPSGPTRGAGARP